MGQTPMGRARQTWLSVHGWLGAATALLMLTIGLSGSTVVFMDDIMRWQLGDAIVSTSKGDWAPPRTLEQAAVAEAGRDFRPIQTYYPNTLIKMSVAMVYGTGGAIATSPEEEVLVFLDPVTSKPQGTVKLDDVWADTILHVHTEFLAGEVGGFIRTICGIILILSALSGIYLWWPRGSQKFSQKLFKLRLGSTLRSKMLTLHHFVGIYFATVILMLAFSGTQQSRPEWFAAILPYEQGNLPSGINPQRGCGAQQPTANQLATVAAQYPDRKFALYNPAVPDYPAQLRLRASNDADQFYGDLYVWLDCKGVLKSIDYGKTGIADKASLMQYSLHSGRTFGPLGPVIVFLAGLALAFFSISGLYLFIKRRFPAKGPKCDEQP
jgi:uncharacterized iron-regulated membrane protein